MRGYPGDLPLIDALPISRLTFLRKQLAVLALLDKLEISAISHSVVFLFLKCFSIPFKAFSHSYWPDGIRPVQ